MRFMAGGAQVHVSAEVRNIAMAAPGRGGDGAARGGYLISPQRHRGPEKNVCRGEPWLAHQHHGFVGATRRVARKHRRICRGDSIGRCDQMIQPKEDVTT